MQSRPYEEGHKLLVGHTARYDWLRGRAAMVHCDGCGCVQVDAGGNCASPDCLLAGQDGHGGAWVRYGAVSEDYVRGIVGRLDRRWMKTALDDEAIELLMNLWLRYEKANELARSINIKKCAALALQVRIVKIRQALGDDITFGRQLRGHTEARGSLPTDEG